MSGSKVLSTPTGPDEQSLVQLKTISRWALIALALGLLSAIALVSPLLAIVPLLAIAAALFSLRSIRASDGQVVGRLPAVVGLCLATFFLGWALAQRFGREAALEQHAREFAEGWLRLVASGDLQQAHQMHVPAHGRILSSHGRSEFYEKNPDARTEMKTFFSNSPLKEFIAAGSDVKYWFDSPVGSARSSTSDTLILKYLFEAQDGQPQPLLISVTREFHPEEEHIDWQIDHVSSEEPQQ